jgi:hypothetical protein
MIEILAYVGAATITVIILVLIARAFLGMLVEHVHTDQIPKSSAMRFQSWNKK